jgi:hypothetical protein
MLTLCCFYLIACTIHLTWCQMLLESILMFHNTLLVLAGCFTNVLVQTISSWSRPLYDLMFACMGSKCMLNSIWCHCTWLLSCGSFWCNFVQPLKKFPWLFATLDLIPICRFLAMFLTSFCFNLLKPTIAMDLVQYKYLVQTLRTISPVDFFLWVLCKY